MSEPLERGLGIALTVASFIPTPASPFLAVAGAGLQADAARRTAKRKAANARKNRERPAGVTANVSGGDESHLLVFGETRVGGVVACFATAETRGELLHISIAHSLCHAGGVEGATGLYLGEKLVPTTRSVITQGSGPTLTRSTLFTNVAGSDFVGLVAARTYHGLATQQADGPKVAAGVIDANSRLAGIAYTAVTLTRSSDDEKFQRAFPDGVPVVTVSLRGIKCYDPRKDSTRGGSGAHRSNDVLTWEWSDNPALIGVTYMLMSRNDGGCGIAEALIDFTSVAASANVCDLTIGTPDGLQPRYRCNITLSTEDDTDDNLEAIAETMAGQIYEQGGVWQFRAGFYEPPSFTIYDDWLAAGLTPELSAGIDSLYNAVRVVYPARQNNYLDIEAQPATDATYEVDDNGSRYWRDISAKGVTGEYQAQYLGHIELRRSRLQRTVPVVCNLRGLLIDLYSTVFLSASVLPEFADVPMRVVAREIKIDPEAGITVVLQLREETPTLFDAPTFVVPPVPLTPNAIPETPPPPSGLTATPVADGIALRWSNPPASSFTYIVIEGSVGSASNLVPIGRVYGDSFTHAVTDGALWFYVVRAVNKTGGTSDASNQVSATNKLVEDGAESATRNTTTFPLNPGFEAGDKSWTKGAGWSIVSGNAARRFGSWAAIYNGGSAASLLTADVKQPCAAGDVVRWSAWGRSSGTTTGTMAVRLSWYSIADALLSSVTSPPISPSDVYAQMRLTATAPVGTAYCLGSVVVTGRTSGTWVVDDTFGAIFPASQDEVPDGSVFGRTNNDVLSGNRPDLSKPIVNRSADNITETATRRWAGETGADTSSANTTSFPLNPGFEAGDKSWVKGIGWSIAVNANRRTGASCAVFTGGTAAITAERAVMVGPGDVVRWTVWLRAASGTNGTAQARINWYTSAGVLISTSTSVSLTPAAAASYAQIRIVGSAPANTAYALVDVAVFNRTTGTWFLDDAEGGIFPASVDEVPDGTTFGRTLSDILSGNRVDLSKPVVNRSLDFINDTGTYARVFANRVNAGRPVLDFNENIHANKNVDNIGDGGVFGRTLQEILTNNRVDLSKPVVNRSLDNISDTATYSRVRSVLVKSGRVLGTTSGANAVANPGFETNAVGGTPILSGVGVVMDGWESTLNGADAFRVERDTTSQQRSGSACLYISFRNTTLANGQTVESRVLSDPITVTAGNVIAWEAYRRIQTNVTFPAGVTGFIRVGVILYDNAGTQVGFQVSDVAVSSGYAVAGNSFTVPAGPGTSLRFVCGSYVQNFSGSSFSTGGSLFHDCRFDDVRMSLVQNLDTEVADGTTYARILGAQLSAGQHRLTVPGSGLRLGDQRNAPAIATANLRSRWINQSISQSYNTASPAVVTISVSAASLRTGNTDTPYNAASLTVTQSRGTTATYYLYFDDAAYTGGAQTLFSTTDPTVIYANDARIYVGAVQVVVPSGATGGTGPGDGGGGACVAASAFEPLGSRFADLHVGDPLLLADEFSLVGDVGAIRTIASVERECVRLTTANGASLTCSLTAPIAVEGRGCVAVGSLVVGDKLGTLTPSGSAWSELVAIEPAGPQLVRPLYVEDRAFWAGDTLGRYILHHNAKAIP